MKYLFAAAVLVATSFASFSAANAAGGCGAGWHRGPTADANPIAATLSLSSALPPSSWYGPPRSWWCGPSAAFAPSASSGLMDAAARCRAFSVLIESEPGSTLLF